MLLRVGHGHWRGSLLILWSCILGGVEGLKGICSGLSLPIMFVRWGDLVEVCASAHRIFRLLDCQVRSRTFASWLFGLWRCGEVLVVEDLYVGNHYHCDANEDFVRLFSSAAA